MDQTTFWTEQTPVQSDQTPDHCCLVCRQCSALVEPREVEGEVYIYGYCFKDGVKSYSPNMGKGYPIYLPLTCGATCKSFKRRRSP